MNHVREPRDATVVTLRPDTIQFGGSARHQYKRLSKTARILIGCLFCFALAMTVLSCTWDVFFAPAATDIRSNDGQTFWLFIVVACVSFALVQYLVRRKLVPSHLTFAGTYQVEVLVARLAPYPLVRSQVERWQRDWPLTHYDVERISEALEAYEEDRRTA